MTVRAAFLCPGQGAQFVGMGRAFAEADASIRALYDEADRVLGTPLSRIAFEGPEEELTKTVNAQPALLLHSVAAQRFLAARGVEPSAAAGHSLGEYSALVAAGALEWTDALRLVRRRGELMYAAGVERAGTMAAILGLQGEAVDALCRAVSSEGDGVVQAANFNSPGQVVISGDVPAVERAMARAKESGARRAVRLTVSGAFHSPLMAPAAAGLQAAIRTARLRDADVAVYANVSGEPVRRAPEIADALDRQLLGAVRWEQSMRAMLRDGATTFVEVGAGTVLGGLMRQIAPGTRVHAVSDPDGAERIAAALASPERAGAVAEPGAA